MVFRVFPLPIQEAIMSKEHEIIFYNQCSEFLTHAPTNTFVQRENATRTYILISVCEGKDGSIGIGQVVVDPGIPDVLSGVDAFKCTLGQHAVTHLNDQLQEAIEESLRQTSQMRKLRDILGADYFDPILKKSANGKEFESLLKEAIKEMPSTQKLKLLQDFVPGL
jgi:hypothetical protein